MSHLEASIEHLRTVSDEASFFCGHTHPLCSELAFMQNWIGVMVELEIGIHATTCESGRFEHVAPELWVGAPVGCIGVIFPQHRPINRL